MVWGKCHYTNNAIVIVTGRRRSARRLNSSCSYVFLVVCGGCVYHIHVRRSPLWLLSDHFK